MFHSSKYTGCSAFQHYRALAFMLHPFGVLVYVFKARLEYSSNGVLSLILRQYKLLPKSL